MTPGQRWVASTMDYCKEVFLNSCSNRRQRSHRRQRFANHGWCGPDAGAGRPVSSSHLGAGLGLAVAAAGLIARSIKIRRAVAAHGTALAHRRTAIGFAFHAATDDDR